MRLIFESIKALEIKTSMLFNLDFANNKFYPACFTFSLLLTYTFNSVAFAQIFNPVAELVIPIGIPRKEVKAEMEIDSVIVEAKIKKCSI